MPEPPKETWIQWVALTTTILAVCAAISALKSSSYSTRAQIFTTREANQWGSFQAKSIKEHSYRLNRDILVADRLRAGKNRGMQKFLAAKIKEYDDEIARDGKEKEQIRREAEDIIKQQELLKRHNGAFALALMLLLIAIMCAAVGALVKKKIMWYVGLLLGVWGLVYMVNGFFLWF
jgi:hypothetical protein